MFVWFFFLRARLRPSGRAKRELTAWNSLEDLSLFFFLRSYFWLVVLRNSLTFSPAKAVCVCHSAASFSVKRRAIRRHVAEVLTATQLDFLVDPNLKYLSSPGQ